MKKNSRYRKYLPTGIGPALMLLVLLTACAGSEEPAGGNTGVAHLCITAGSPGPEQTRTGGAPFTEEGTDEERSYNALFLYYYIADNGNFLELQKISTTGQLPLVVGVPVKVSRYKGAVDVYVFASPSAADAMPTAPTREELTALTAGGMVSGLAGGKGQLTYPDGATRYLPMSARFTYDFSADHPATVSLRRTVAKLRIRVEVADEIAALDGSIIRPMKDRLTMDLTNLRAESPFLPVAAGEFTPPAIATFGSQTFSSTAPVNSPEAFVPQQTTSNGATVDWLHTVYVNEHLFDTALGTALPADRATIAINLPYTITVGSNTPIRHDENRYILPLDFPLERNGIYQLTVKVQGPAASGPGASTVILNENITIPQWTPGDNIQNDPPFQLPR